MTRKKKIWFSLLFVIVVAAAASAYFVLQNGKEVGTSVEIAPVERMTIVQTVTATGRIQPRTQVNISADVSAKITRLEVEEGDWVEKGSFLVELDGDRYEAAVESSEASLRVSESNADIARENLTKAEKDYNRIRELFDQDLETQAQLDAAYASFQAEKARRRSSLDQVEQARAALRQFRDDLSKTRIFAPMSGTISELNKEVGEIALGSQFQEDVIMVLSNLAGMEALVDVDENDIVSVAVDDASTIEVDALPEVELAGEVTDIANSAKVAAQGTTDQKTEFEVKIAVKDLRPELRPGMTCSSDIITDTHEDVIGVPIQCVAVRTPEQLMKEMPGGEIPGNGNGGNSAGATELASEERTSVSDDQSAQTTAGGEESDGAAEQGGMTDGSGSAVPLTGEADPGAVDTDSEAAEPSAAQTEPMETADAHDADEREWVPDKDGFVEIVWVVKDGRALARQVKTGIQSDTHIEIVSGLSGGEEVVVGSYRAISRDLQHDSDVILEEGETEEGANHDR